METMYGREVRIILETIGFPVLSASSIFSPNLLRQPLSIFRSLETLPPTFKQVGVRFVGVPVVA